MVFPFLFDLNFSQLSGQPETSYPRTIKREADAADDKEAVTLYTKGEQCGSPG